MSDVPWMLMSEAPRDGTSFLAYWVRRHTDGTRYEAAGAFVVAHFMGGRLWPSWIDADDLPTHWTHLPAPPVVPDIA